MMQSTEALRERLLEVDDQSIMVDSVNGANDFSRVARCKVNSQAGPREQRTDSEC